MVACVTYIIELQLLHLNKKRHPVFTGWRSAMFWQFHGSVSGILIITSDSSSSCLLAEKPKHGLGSHVGLGQGRGSRLLQDLQSNRLALLLGKVGVHDPADRRLVGADRL
jgi:hypothetical protein